MAEERVQRRLAAIMTADVVGYSRLMREDETGTLSQLKVLRKEGFDPRIAEHNGCTVKTTVAQRADPTVQDLAVQCQSGGKNGSASTRRS